MNDHPHYGGIPESDLVALRGYTRDEFYGPMNSALRHGDAAALQHLDPLVRGTTSALNQLPEYSGTVFRGIRTDPVGAAEIAARYNPGDVVPEHAFTGTSADVTKSFDGPIEMVIDSKTGRDITDISRYGTLEREVLFAPGTRFEVLDRAFDDASQKWRIILREV
ncbi:MAG: ADP-ribosyltransferase domain-containing protein [Pseudonocardiaceae bacterium]